MMRYAIFLFFFAASAQAAPGPEIHQAIVLGKSLYMHETFGGNGRTCNTCHTHGGVGQGALPNGKAIPSLENAAAIFPRYNKRMNKIITLEDQIHSCINGGLQGNPPEYGSEKLLELVSYVTSLSQGKPLDMDGQPH
jgi:thiosulfate dehydrogenase